MICKIRIQRESTSTAPKVVYQIGSKINIFFKDQRKNDCIQICNQVICRLDFFYAINFAVKSHTIFMPFELLSATLQERKKENYALKNIIDWYFIYVNYGLILC